MLVATVVIIVTVQSKDICSSYYEFPAIAMLLERVAGHQVRMLGL